MKIPYIDLTQFLPQCEVLQEQHEALRAEYRAAADRLYRVPWGASVGYYGQEDPIAVEGWHWHVAPLFGGRVL